MGGVRLVDAPGLHDDNSARANTVKSFLKQADSVFLVSNIKRAVNDKTTKDLMPLQLRKTLLSTGKLGQLVFIATQTDELLPSEIRENLRLEDSTSPADCAAARNSYTKQKLTDDFYRGVDTALRPVNRAAGDVYFEFPIFTVSSVDFQKLCMTHDDGPPKTFTSPDATEIPALRKFIQAVAGQHAEDRGAWGRTVGELVLEVVQQTLTAPADSDVSAESSLQPGSVTGAGAVAADARSATVRLARASANYFSGANEAKRAKRKSTNSPKSAGTFRFGQRAQCPICDQV
jgi:hypothetical protein